LENVEDLRTIELGLTARCNLSCDYCGHFSTPAAVSQEIAHQAWASFLAEACEAGAKRVVMSGGEPFLRRDLSEILSDVCKCGFTFSILTNATLVSENVARFIAGTGRCSTVEVALDGQSPEVHDWHRGAGSFTAAVKGIEVLVNEGITVSVGVCVMPHNIDHLDAIADFVLCDLAVECVGFGQVRPLGRARDSGICYLSPDQWTRAFKILHALESRYGDRILTGGMFDSVRCSWNQESAGKACGGGFLNGCGAGGSLIAVRPDGIITPCLALGHIELGRVNADSLIDIWNEHPELMRLRRRRLLSLSTFESCRECRYLHACDGGCAAVSYIQMGSDRSPDPSSCLRVLEEAGVELDESGGEHEDKTRDLRS
jgi:SynChlorMet cassette radical SAM/SPASM protein ScmE